MFFYFHKESEKSGSRKKLGQIDGSIYGVNNCMIPCFLILIFFIYFLFLFFLIFEAISHNELRSWFEVGLIPCNMLIHASGTMKSFILFLAILDLTKVP
jgi:hypothetical protein